MHLAIICVFLESGVCEVRFLQSFNVPGVIQVQAVFPDGTLVILPESSTSCITRV